MGYEPYLIGNYRSGFNTSVQPWLLPQDAFSDLYNAYVDKGVVYKRKGMTLFSLFTSSNNPIVGLFEYVLTTNTKQLVAMNTRRFGVFSDATGLMDEIPEGANYDIFSGTARDFFSASQQWAKDPSDNLSHNLMFFTNGIDPVKYYNGITIQTPIFDFYNLPATTNNLTTCKELLFFKNYLLLFSPTEDGQFFPQRIRWSNTTGNTRTIFQWNDDNFLDLDTYEHIMSVHKLKDDLIVFCENSIFCLRYTGDPDLLFRAERIQDMMGTDCPRSVIQYNKFLGAISLRSGIFVTDGCDARRIDDNVPDIVYEEIDQDRKWAVNAGKIERLSQIWWLIPKGCGCRPGLDPGADHAIVYNYDNGSWALADIDVTTFLQSRTTRELTWGSIKGTWDENDKSWNDAVLNKGAAATLAGDQYGRIFALNDGSMTERLPVADFNSLPLLDPLAPRVLDNLQTTNQGINFRMITGRFNPYKEEGRQARLGYIDLLVYNGGARASIAFYKDHDAAPFREDIIECDRGELFGYENNLVWKRVYVGVTGSFHMIKIEQVDFETNPTLFEIHGMVLWFQRAGRLYPINF